MSNAIETLAVSAVYATAATAVDRCGGEVIAYRSLGRWLLRELYRFCDGLPTSHHDVDLEVLKRVPTPV